MKKPGFGGDVVARRDLLIALSIAAATATRSASSLAASPVVSSEDAKMLSLLDKIFSSILSENPEMATNYGQDSGPARGHLSDRSLQGDQRRLEQMLSYIAALKGIQSSELSPARARQHVIALDTLENAARTRQRFAYGDDSFFAYRLTQFTGAYATIPDLLDQMQTVQSSSDVDAYLSRLTQFARVLDQETERQTADARSGIVAPNFILEIVIANLKRLRQPEAARDALITPLRNKAAAVGLSDKSAEAISILNRLVLPALDRQIAATMEVLRLAKSNPGVCHLPDGDAFYRDALYFSTTSKITPEEAHSVGLEKIREIESKLDALLTRQGYTKGSCSARLEAIKRDPAQYFPDSDAGRTALIAYFSDDRANVNEALPQAFSTLPAVDVEVRRMPLGFEGMGPSAAYSRAPDDGSRKSAIIIDLKDMSKWPRFSLKTLCRHEGIPGHHLHQSLVHEAGDTPKLLTILGSSSYGEGWALYAEQLTQEMGLYEDDPMGEIGMWQSLLYRAARIVVDTGIHHKRWNRVEAVNYMVRTTAMPQEMMETEVNRYAIIPGQACGYMLGQIEWRRIREKVRQKMGTAFDLRQFHEVLRDGMMPMAMLEQYALSR